MQSIEISENDAWQEMGAERYQIEDEILMGIESSVIQVELGNELKPMSQDESKSKFEKLSDYQKKSHSLDLSEIFDLFQSSPSGLTKREADARQTVFGRNELPRAKATTWLEIVVNQLKSPLVIILIAAGVISIAADPQNGFKNGLVILCVVVLNTLIGFIQELKASREIQAISELVPLSAQVIRDGQLLSLSASELVPGDVIKLSSGDKVPADIRLTQVKFLQVEEAALTGESVPVEKSTKTSAPDAALGDRLGMAYAGTFVTYGTGTGVVVATGAKTELGKISHLMATTVNLETPLTQSLAKIAKIITVIILVLALIILVLGTMRMTWESQMGFGASIREMLVFSIALAVGAIPEGLPAVVTIALAVGVRRMAKKKAVIRNLPSVETLGSTTVICTDKTGTLTRNEMTVSQLVLPGLKECEVSGAGYNIIGQVQIENLRQSEKAQCKRLLRAGAICNDASIRWSQDSLQKTSSTSIPEHAGDPTEVALLVSAKKAGIDCHTEKLLSKRLDVVPFESEKQFMATLNSETHFNSLLLKGAPEVVLEKCRFESPDEKLGILRKVSLYADEGLRVLAFAEKQVSQSQKQIEPKDLENNFDFVGLQVMSDPPRIEVKDSIEKCKAAGISVKMITGDHPRTAHAIGRFLGILGPSDKTMIGREIDQLSDHELSGQLMTTHVFARVAPEHKLRLVKALQSQNQVVAMTGDGVNDAPALKQANIGVAMGITGTSVSKEASDLVLADDNFQSISSAVEEGRRVFDNLTKSLAFILPTNLSLALILIYAILFFPFIDGNLQVPVLPAQILWINLVGAVGLALPLAFEAKEPSIMSRPPRDSRAPILSRFLLFRTITVAMAMTAGTILLFKYEYSNEIQKGFDSQYAASKAQTYAVTAVIFFQIFYVLCCRSLKSSVFKIGLFSNKKIFVGIAAVLLLQGLLLYFKPFQVLFETAPLSASELFLICGVGSLIVPIIALEKWCTRNLKK